jgi:hypothetical protein
MNMESGLRHLSEVGHVPTFATPLNRVWNAAVNGHSRPNVGNAAVYVPSNAPS